MDIEQKARELFAEWHRQRGCTGRVIDDCLSGANQMPELAAQLVAMALTPPEGYVLVPVEPTEAMIEGFWGKIRHGDHERATAEDAWRDALAARPEVP